MTRTTCRQLGGGAGSSHTSAAAAAATAVLLLTLTAVSACSDRARPSSPAPFTPEPTQTLPAAEALTAPIAATDAPLPLPDTPTEKGITRLADGNDRASAEAFGLAFTQAVVDTRHAVSMESLLHDVGCDDLPADERQAVIDEIASQSAIGTTRQWNPDQSMWLRTENHETGYGVEVAGVVIDTADDYVGWSRFRLDVGRNDGTWCVSHVGAETFGPDDALQSVREAHLRDNLHGKGWREIKP